MSTLVLLPEGFPQFQEEYELHDKLGIYLPSLDTIDKNIVSLLTSIHSIIPQWMAEYFARPSEKYSYADKVGITKSIAFLRRHNDMDDSGFSGLIDFLTNCSVSIALESSWEQEDKINRNLVNEPEITPIIMTLVILKATSLLMHNNYALPSWMVERTERCIQENIDRKLAIASLSGQSRTIALMKYSLDDATSVIERYVSHMVKSKYEYWFKTDLCCQCIGAVLKLQYVLGLDTRNTIKQLMICFAKSGSKDLKHGVGYFVYGIIQKTLIPELLAIQKLEPEDV